MPLVRRSTIALAIIGAVASVVTVADLRQPAPRNMPFKSPTPRSRPEY